MPEATPELTPNVEETTQDSQGLDKPWRVTLFNDEMHTFQEVVRQLMRATGCSQHEAEEMTMRVHHQGQCDVYEGEVDDCFRVAGVLEEIRLETKIQG